MFDKLNINIDAKLKSTESFSLVSSVFSICKELEFNLSSVGSGIIPAGSVDIKLFESSKFVLVTSTSKFTVKYSEITNNSIDTFSLMYNGEELDFYFSNNTSEDIIVNFIISK